MTQKRFSTQYDPHPVKGEINTKPSLTIPNEAMSIREILVRYSRGLPIDTKVPMYEEEQLLPNVKHMDLADLQTLRENVAEEIQQKKTHLDKITKEAQHKKQLEALELKKQERQQIIKEMKEMPA